MLSIPILNRPFKISNPELAKSGTEIMTGNQSKTLACDWSVQKGNSTSTNQLTGTHQVLHTPHFNDLFEYDFKLSKLLMQCHRLSAVTLYLLYISMVLIALSWWHVCYICNAFKSNKAEHYRIRNKG